jgi:UDP-N-acetylglucosamine transferase subunit ALG13
MNYTETCLQLSSKGFSEKFLDNHQVKITHEQFRAKPYWENESLNSTCLPKEVFNGYNSLNGRNLNFDYPIISPVSEQTRGVIILLHGLNERNWNKYYPWAIALAQKTQKHVILFPISYHMNRAPESWGDPRQMEPYVSARQKNIPGVKNLSVANIALSERLTIDPEQFFLSGYQSASEIQQLIGSIRNGKIVSIGKHSKIDFFGYSIGAFLTEIVALANESNKPINSDYFLFCGGCTFDKLNVDSKYILDSEAFRILKDFYNQNLNDEMKKKNLFSALLNSTRLGKAFQTMLKEKDMKKTIQNHQTNLKKHIYAIGLKKDSVIQYKDLVNTLQGAQVEVMDFEYNYSHEMPFPVYTSDKKKLVDEAFENIFTKASEQLKKTTPSLSYA